MTKDELLQFALENDMLDIGTIREQYEMNEKQKYLAMHKSKIWQSTDNKWYTYIIVNNKRKLIKRTTRESLNEAIVDAYKSENEDPTIETIFYEWLHRKLNRREIQPQTYDRYEIDFTRFFTLDNFKDYKIRYVTSKQLDAFIINNIKKHNLTSKAWSNLRTLIKGIFKYAKKEGYSNLDIIDFLEYLELSPKIFSKTRKQNSDNVFTAEEMNTLIDYCFNNKSIYTMGILFAAYSGMRVGEIVGLKWEDIQDRIIKIHRTQVNYKDADGNTVRFIRDSTKTDAGMREIVIIPQLQCVLDIMKGINPNTEYVFEYKGKPLLKNTLSKKLNKICKNLDFNPRGMHVLRKTFITCMIDGKVEEAIITSHSGHTDISTSLQYYYYNNKTLEYMTNAISNSLTY